MNSQSPKNGHGDSLSDDQLTLVKTLKKVLDKENRGRPAEFKTSQLGQKLHLIFTLEGNTRDKDSLESVRLYAALKTQVKEICKTEEIVVLQFLDTNNTYQAFTFRYCQPYLDFQF